MSRGRKAIGPRYAFRLAPADVATLDAVARTHTVIASNGQPRQLTRSEALRQILAELRSVGYGDEQPDEHHQGKQAEQG